MSSMVASRKERFHVKQAQPDTTEVAPGIGDSAAGPPTDNFAKMDPRFKDPKVQLPDYEASPGAFDHAANGPPSKQSGPEMYSSNDDGGAFSAAKSNFKASPMSISATNRNQRTGGIQMNGDMGENNYQG